MILFYSGMRASARLIFQIEFHNGLELLCSKRTTFEQSVDNSASGLSLLLTATMRFKRSEEYMLYRDCYHKRYHKTVLGTEQDPPLL